MTLLKDFSIDDKESLTEAMADDSWYAIMKLLERLHGGYVNRVMVYDLNNGPERLVIEKARAEGSLKLIKDLEKVRNQIIRPSVEEKPKKRSRRNK